MLYIVSSHIYNFIIYHGSIYEIVLTVRGSFALLSFALCEELSWVAVVSTFTVWPLEFDADEPPFNTWTIIWSSLVMDLNFPDKPKLSSESAI